MPISSMILQTVSGGRSIRIPSASITSADPQVLLTLRFPCFTICTPAPALTNAAVVLILKVEEWSPPVPQVSTMVPDIRGWNGTARESITPAKDVISSAVTPFIRRAVSRLPIWAFVASPAAIWVITSVD